MEGCTLGARLSAATIAQKNRMKTCWVCMWWMLQHNSDQR